jgi:DNA gyrase subunit A
MAKQLSILSSGQVISTALHTEMQQSYLEYAMSVIVGRALPDVRDGLKPVHRRILYAMHELGLTPDRPYRKCARVVGDVLGKYHPHGDQSVYEALVRMVQTFSSRYPLAAGHGNFGSIDNDPPAAMRYTETRLSAIGQEGLLGEISEATVNFVSNFDNSQQEPVVLPAKLPVVLLNGCSGIAVGMATNIPPHNLSEVVDGLIALIDSPTLSDEQLFKLIPGPDFPTGGEILDNEGIYTAYTTGRGTIPIRGITAIEEIERSRGRHRRNAIIVTELPFQVNKSAWIEKIADLVNEGRISGVADIRDESDRDGMRVVIELKRETDPEIVREQLYQHTALQSNFGAILLVLVNGEPRQLTLREILQEFLGFREETLTKEYSQELRETENRLHILSGSLLALTNLDRTIAILRDSPDGIQAKVRLQTELSLSDRQAEAILAMPLRRLTGLERQKLQAELDQLSQRQQELQKLLSDRQELLKALKKDLRALKRKYGDERRTRIIAPKNVGQKMGAAQISSEGTKSHNLTKEKKSAGKQAKTTAAAGAGVAPDVAFKPEDTVVEFTYRGYVKRVSPQNFERPKPDNSATKDIEVIGKAIDDFSRQTYLTRTDKTVVVFTRTGKAYPLNLRDLQLTNGRSSKHMEGRGTPLITLLPSSVQGDPNIIATQLLLSDQTNATDLVLLTKRGRIKRISVEQISNLSNRGLTVVKLKDGDELLSVNLTKPGEFVILATSGGRLLRLEVNEDHLPMMSYGAQPQQALRLGKQENLVGFVTLNEADKFLFCTQDGWAKRMKVSSLRLANPGDIGTQSLQFKNQTDTVVGIVPAVKNGEVILVTSQDRLLNLPMNAVKLWEKDGSGDRIKILQPHEQILSLNLSIVVDES